jgi:hypothetical protein
MKIEIECIEKAIAELIDFHTFSPNYDKEGWTGGYVYALSVVLDMIQIQKGKKR